MKRLLPHIIFFSCLFAGLFSADKVAGQTHGQFDTVKVYAYVTPEGDTIPYGGFLPSVEVYGRMSKQWRNYWADWTRLRNAVYVTFPYAKRASVIFH